MRDGLVSVDEVWPQVIALMTFPGEFIYVNGSMERGEMYRGLKNNYRRKQAMVDAGIDEWFRSDPYEIANWLSIFTPIEEAIWQDIRRMGLDLWPQFPVGRFWVDFGNPVARIALECDGAKWHMDKDKDRARDDELRAMGWTVFRIPGYQCKAEILTRAEAEEERGIDPEDYEAWRDRETPHTALMDIKEHLRGYRLESQDQMRIRTERRAPGLA
jgi:hypothetical protein